MEGNDISLVVSLIDQTRVLKRGDKKELDALIKRAKMIIRKIFGSESEYLKDLENIYFTPLVTSTDVVNDHYGIYWDEGKGELINLLNTAYEELNLIALKDLAVEENQYLGEIFIVHGHNEEMKLNVAYTLKNINFKPIILHEQPDEGRTIIEKFEVYSDVKFAIILLSPDDTYFYKKNKKTIEKTRARQNVILELGFFLGKLGRSHVLILYLEDENFEMPSDYAGVLYTKYDKDGAWRLKLVKELKSCGFDIDTNKLL